MIIVNICKLSLTIFSWKENGKKYWHSIDIMAISKGINRHFFKDFTRFDIVNKGNNLEKIYPLGFEAKPFGFLDQPHNHFDNNNCATSFWGHCVKLEVIVLDWGIFLRELCSRRKYWGPKQSLRNSHNDCKIDGAKLLLSLITAITFLDSF